MTIWKGCRRKWVEQANSTVHLYELVVLAPGDAMVWPEHSTDQFITSEKQRAQEWANSRGLRGLFPEERDIVKAWWHDVANADAQAKLNAILDVVVDQEVLLAGLVAQAQAAAANRPAEGLCPADQIGLPMVPDPKSPQPPSGTFSGMYVCRDGFVARYAPDRWDAYGNHVTDSHLDLMRRIREGEGQ